MSDNQQQVREKAFSNFIGKSISVITATYFLWNFVIAPIFPSVAIKDNTKEIQTPDIILAAVVLLFNSNLLDRLENFGVSKEGGFTAKFQQLNQQISSQKKQINELQAQQLEQLEDQQKNLEDMQAFMYNLLLGKKDFEKIEQLDKHSEAKTNYQFNVSDRVADELRRLRDLELIDTKDGFMSDLVKASEGGKREIDLTNYLYVTKLGKKFLMTREKLQFNDEQELEGLETPE